MQLVETDRELTPTGGHASCVEGASSAEAPSLNGDEAAIRRARPERRQYSVSEVMIGRGMSSRRHSAPARS
jgi:hypothetical protein